MSNLGSIPFERSIVRKKSTQYRFDIDPDVYRKFMAAIANGVSIDDSAYAAGSYPRRIYDWLAKGEVLFESDAELLPGTAAWQYARFWHDFKQANSSFVVRHVTNINDAAVNGISGDWKASAWSLERGRANQFSPQHLLEQLTDKKMLELVKFMFERSPTDLFREQLAAIIQEIPKLQLKDVT